MGEEVREEKGMGIGTEYHALQFSKLESSAITGGVRGYFTFSP